jgi:hypothetical protein
VVRAQKGIMRLVEGLKQARNPDAFMAPLLIVSLV